MPASFDLGANPLAVAQRRGHSDAAFTLRVYGHLFEGVQAKLSEQLDALRERTANSPAMGTLVNFDARRHLTPAGHASAVNYGHQGVTTVMYYRRSEPLSTP
jgi:hypothetical protein